MNETTKNVGITEFDSNFFDNASKCWKENKIEQNNGTYLYRCCYIKNDDERCQLPICYGKKKNKNYSNIFCTVHMNISANKKRKFNDII